MNGVLFDLDGTLLDVEMGEFLSRYFHALDAAVSPLFPDVKLVQGVLAATEAMQRPHPGLTNREAFNIAFLDRTGIDLVSQWPPFESFYRDVFPRLGEGLGPVAGAREAIAAARRLGWKVAIATQPIFPASAIRDRLRWAGLGGVEFDAITTYEVMESCKPDPTYFSQLCDMIGCAPRDCVMVGDDAQADMPASDVGIVTFFVGRGKAACDHRGGLADLPALLERLDRRR